MMALSCLKLCFVAVFSFVFSSAFVPLTGYGLKVTQELYGNNIISSRNYNVETTPTDGILHQEFILPPIIYWVQQVSSYDNEELD